MSEPELVWHYTDAQGLLSILGGHTLWATSAQFLNDAGEVALGSSLLLAELQERGERDPFYAELSAFTRRPKPHDWSIGEFFVLSAACDWDLLPVWRNYGGRGESYAIGLDATAPLSVLATSGVPHPHGLDRVVVRHLPWTPVAYDPAAQRALVDAAFDNLKEQLVRARAQAASGSSTQHVLAGLGDVFDGLEQALLLIKHQGFGDEREVRHSTVLYRGWDQLDLSSWDGSETADRDDRTVTPWPPGLVQYRATAYGLAPYLRLTGSSGQGSVATAASPLPIRALAISPSGYSGATARTLHDLLAAHGYPPVPVHRSEIPFRN